MSTFDKLIGKTITEVHINASKEQIEFHTNDGGLFPYWCDADCCSESWINHVSNIEALKGQTVLSCADIDMPEIKESYASGRQEVDCAYGYSLTTQAGVCLFEMRNSSNGYYGGWLKEGSYAKDAFTEILEDF